MVGAGEAKIVRPGLAKTPESIGHDSSLAETIITNQETKVNEIATPIVTPRYGRATRGT